MSHMFPLKHPTFKCSEDAFYRFSDLYLSFFLSFFHLSEYFLFSSISISLPVSAHARLWPPGAVGAVLDLRSGPIPDPPACVDRLSANLLLISWRDEAIARFPSYRIWRMTHYLHTLNFRAAVISFEHLEKHQLWAGKPDTCGRKKSGPIFLSNKSEQPGLLSHLVKILRALLDPSLRHHSAIFPDGEHLHFLTISRVNDQSRSNSVLSRRLILTA